MLNINNDLKQIVTNKRDLSWGYKVREGFIFRRITPPENVFDAIELRQPGTECEPYRAESFRTFDEHIKFINEYKLEKALVIANDLSFIKKCPTLKYISVTPSYNAPDNFDYSPLYELPDIRFLDAYTEYGAEEELSTTLDCSRLSVPECLYLYADSMYNYKDMPSLKSIMVRDYDGSDLYEMFSGSQLEVLLISHSSIKSLAGIENAKSLQCLQIAENKELCDISALNNVKGTLRLLRIFDCHKIKDFDVLKELSELEVLILYGKNHLPNLDFLKNMKKLKKFIFDMKVDDENLLPCMNIPYVRNCSDKKVYNVRDKDLPKNENVVSTEYEGIDEWRRFPF